MTLIINYIDYVDTILKLLNDSTVLHKIDVPNEAYIRKKYVNYLLIANLIPSTKFYNSFSNLLRKHNCDDLNRNFFRRCVHAVMILIHVKFGEDTQ